MARRGREALNEEIQNKICKSIREGNNLSVAAKIAGISHRTLNNWIKKGQEQKKGKYFQFFQEVKKAEAEAEQYAVATIRKAMGSSWQAAAWWLERKYPEKWGKKEYVEADVKHYDKEYAKKIEEAIEKEPELLSAIIDIQSRIFNAESRNNGIGRFKRFLDYGGTSQDS